MAIASVKLTTPVTSLNRIGTALGNRLKRLGIICVRDLLYHFPFRYEDFSHVVRIADLVEGVSVTIKAKIEIIVARRSPRKRTFLTEAMVSDGTGQLRIVWFGQPYIATVLQTGDEVYFSGKITRDMLGPQLVSPNYEKVKTGIATAHTARIVPLYPLTEGITHKQIRFLMSQVIDAAQEIHDWVPLKIVQQAHLPSLAEALYAIHFPKNQEDITKGTARLKFDELFILQLRAEMIRQELAREHAPNIKFVAEPIKKFVAGLPFGLTHDQKTAAWEIFQDMEREEPMNRLLEGDVGSGKTVVAAMAAYQAVQAGYQVAIMVPTEILARQHFETIGKLLESYTISIALVTSNTFLKTQSGICRTNVKSQNLNLKLKNENTDVVPIKSGSRKIKERELFLQSIQNGEISLVIGTHALLTSTVQFKNLGLVIVDEQHRFGVQQRHILREKSGMSRVPHFLSMTATPIPRSFALTLFGDLDISIIKQMPAGRLSIKTRLVAPHHRTKAYEFIREEIKKGRQVFVICPLIDDQNTDNPLSSPPRQLAGDYSEASRRQITNNNEIKTVLKEYEHLSKEIFPDARVGFLHGKIKSKEKDEIMQEFAAGKIDILVATSVVEVGVNIPNASVMMIEGAERFGLAQLHQFRGRVGRSVHQSYCFLFTESDSQKSTERLALFEKTTDGFALAEYDLNTRGPGEVYGTTQSGLMHLRLASMRDVGIIKRARELARGVDFNQYPTLREKVKEWENTVHLE